MNCPTCKTALHISDRQGVEIDFCPTCRGVWLDRGELDKIIERAAREFQPSPESDPSHPGYIPSRIPPVKERQKSRYDDDDDYKWKKKRKRESFLSDLFDF